MSRASVATWIAGIDIRMLPHEVEDAVHDRQNGVTVRLPVQGVHGLRAGKSGHTHNAGYNGKDR
eukprot:2169395-Pleurochrysis_carterae.AAC.1